MHKNIEWSEINSQCADQLAILEEYSSRDSDSSSSVQNDQKLFTPTSTSITVKALNFKDNILQGFAQLYSQPDTADVSITCGRNHCVLRAHKFVLTCGSLYFRDALEVAKCKHPIIVIKDIEEDVMSWILEYIYLGKVAMKSEDELKQFLSSAKYLQVTGFQIGQNSVDK